MPTAGAEIAEGHVGHDEGRVLGHHVGDAAQDEPGAHRGDERVDVDADDQHRIEQTNHESCRDGGKKRVSRVHHGADPGRDHRA